MARQGCKVVQERPATSGVRRAALVRMVVVVQGRNDPLDGVAGWWCDTARAVATQPLVGCNRRQPPGRQSTWEAQSSGHGHKPCAHTDTLAQHGEAGQGRAGQGRRAAPDAGPHAACSRAYDGRLGSSWPLGHDKLPAAGCLSSKPQMVWAPQAQHGTVVEFKNTLVLCIACPAMVNPLPTLYKTSMCLHYQPRPKEEACRLPASHRIASLSACVASALALTKTALVFAFQSRGARHAVCPTPVTKK